MVIPIKPRPLNQAELAVLERILSVEFPGHDELLRQLDAVTVVAVWAEDSVSIDLHVSAEPGQSELSGPLPVRPIVHDESGEPVGEFVVWVDRGNLCALEYAWYGEEMPTTLPSPASITIE